MTIFYIILLTLAAVPLILTIWKMNSVANFRKQGVYTSAIITGITPKWSRAGKKFDILTLQYKDIATSKSYHGQTISKPQKYKTGDTMELIYLPAKPSKHIVVTKKSYWGLLIFSIVIFLFFVFAVYKLDEIMR